MNTRQKGAKKPNQRLLPQPSAQVPIRGTVLVPVGLVAKLIVLKVVISQDLLYHLRIIDSLREWPKSHSSSVHTYLLQYISHCDEIEHIGSFNICPIFRSLEVSA